jgi:Ca-activated chloride channel family protein
MARSRKRWSSTSPAPTQWLLVLSFVAALVASGCGTATPADDSNALRVLASTELRDLEPMLADIEEATGVTLKVEYDTAAGVSDKLVHQVDLRASDYDLAWLASDRILHLRLDEAGSRIRSESIMTSPVVLGVKQSVAGRLGWAKGTRVTWADIANKAGAGELTFGMTDPTASHSGFAAVLGTASAFSATNAALRAGDVDQVRLTNLFAGQSIVAGSADWLVQTFVRDQQTIDGLINDESVIASLNASGKLAEPLEMIYPAGGIVSANYPLLLLNGQHSAEYQRVLDYLRSEDAQQEMTEKTLRRPVNPAVKPDPRLPQADLAELAFPDSRMVTDELVNAYRNRARRPVHTIFVLDYSKGMDGDRIGKLRSAFTALTGPNPAAKQNPGSAAPPPTKEKVTVLRFADGILDERTVSIDTPESPGRAEINNHVNSAASGPNSGIWSALERGYQRAAEFIATDPNYMVSIVLITDGENNSGISLDDFLNRYRQFPLHVQKVRTFTVRVAEANALELAKAANSTGGQAIDTNPGSLSQIFTELRTYQ